MIWFDQKQLVPQKIGFPTEARLFFHKQNFSLGTPARTFWQYFFFLLVRLQSVLTINVYDIYSLCIEKIPKLMVFWSQTLHHDNIRLDWYFLSCWDYELRLNSWLWFLLSFSYQVCNKKFREEGKFFVHLKLDFSDNSSFLSSILRFIPNMFNLIPEELLSEKHCRVFFPTVLKPNFLR